MWRITRDSIRVLMDTVPSDVDLPEIVAALLEINGAEDAHHVHASALTTGRNLFSAHLLIASEADSQKALTEAYAIVCNDFGFYFSTIQVRRNANRTTQPQLSTSPIPGTSTIPRSNPSRRA